MTQKPSPIERVTSFLHETEAQANPMEYARATIQLMTQVELDELSKRIDQDVNVPDIFKQASIKEEIQKSIRTRLDALRKQTQDLKPVTPTPESATAVSQSTEETPWYNRAGNALLDGVHDTADTTGGWVHAAAAKMGMKVDPSKQRNAGYLAMGVTVGVLAIAAWAWNRGKSASDSATKEGGWFWKTVAAGVTVVGGIALWQFLKKKYGWGSILEIGKDKLSGVEKKLREKMDQLKNATGAERDRLVQEIEDLMHDKKTKETTRSAAEMVSQHTLDKAYGFQYDVMRGIDPALTSPRPYLTDAKMLTELAAQKQLPMRHFFLCMDENTDASYDELVRSILSETDYQSLSLEDKNKKITAAKLMVGFLKKNRTTIEDNVRFTDKKTPEEMTFGEATNFIVRFPEAMGDFGAMIAASANSLVHLELPDIDIDQILERAKGIPDEALFAIHSNVSKTQLSLQSSLTEREQFRNEAKRAALFFSEHPDTRMSLLDSALTPWLNQGKIATGSNEEHMIRTLVSEVRTGPELLNDIRKALFIPEKESERAGKDTQIFDYMSNLLRDGKVKLSDAYQLYVLSHSGAGAKPLLTLKCIQILKNYAENNEQRTFANDRYLQATEVLVSKSVEYAKYGIDQEWQVELGNVGDYALEEAGSYMRDGMNLLVTVAERYPKTSAALGITGVTAGGLWVRSVIQWDKIQKIVNLDPSDAIAVKRLMTQYNIAKEADAISLIKDMKALAFLRDQVGFRLSDKIPFVPTARRWFLRNKGIKRITNAGQVAPHVPAPAPSSPPPVPPRAPTPGPSSAPTSGPSTAPRIIDDAAWEKILAKCGGKAKPDDVISLLELARDAGKIDLDKPTLALIRESEGAKKIIAGAIETTDVDEVARALKAAKMAAGWRVAFNAVGAAGDIFGIYMAYADWQANGKRIAETDNQALKDLYANANYVYGVEAGSSAVGLVIGGTAIIQSYAAGEGVLAALGTSAGTIMLPIAVAAMAGGFVYRGYEGASEQWTKNEKDFVKDHEGSLQRQLEDYAPGKQGYWQGGARSTNAEEIWNSITMSREDYEEWDTKGYETIEGANANMRRTITQAYIARMSMLQQEPGESQKDYEKRLDHFISIQTQFIGMDTNGTYPAQYPDFYRRAENYAELVMLCEKLKKQKKSNVIVWESIAPKQGGGTVTLKKSFDLAQFDTLLLNKPNENGITGSEVLSAYSRQKEEGVVLQLNVMHQLTGTGKNAEHLQDKTVQFSLLKEIRHDLSRAEMRILGTDFNGLWVTGGERAGQDMARYVLSFELRKMMRTEADRLRALPGINIEEMDESISRLRSFLQKDPVEYQEIGAKGYTLPKEFEGASTPLTNWHWVTQNLFVHPATTSVPPEMGTVRPV